jgi:tetratricopeptide (TPR) repeat protein
MKKIVFAFSFILFFSSTIFAQNAQQLYDEGLQLRKDGKSKDALERFKRAVALKPNFTDALYEIGWCQNDTKDYKSAMETLRKVRQQWGTVPKVYFELGYAFEKSSLIDSAISSYKKCLALKNDYSLAWKQLGYISYNADNNKEALEYFSNYERSAKAAITDYLYWYRKGFVCNALQQYESAKSALNKSLGIKKDYLNTYLELGFSCTRLKQDDEAISYFKKAIDLDPNSHIPYNGIGEVYRDNKKDRIEAMVWYRKSLKINPNERKANYGIGYCLNSTGKYEEAISYLKRAIESENTYAAAYVELGYSYYMTGKNTEALASLNKAISLNAKNENARYYAALVYINMKDKANAQRVVDELKVMASRHAAGLQEKINKM